MGGGLFLVDDGILVWNAEEIVKVDADQVWQLVGQFKGHAFLLLVRLSRAIDNAPGEPLDISVERRLRHAAPPDHAHVRDPHVVNGLGWQNAPAGWNVE